MFKCIQGSFMKPIAFEIHCDSVTYELKGEVKLIFS